MKKCQIFGDFFSLKKNSQKIYCFLVFLFHFFGYEKVFICNPSFYSDFSDMLGLISNFFCLFIRAFLLYLYTIIITESVNIYLCTSVCVIGFCLLSNER